MLLRSKDHEFWISGKAKSNAVGLMLVIEGLVSEFGWLWYLTLYTLCGKGAHLSIFILFSIFSRLRQSFEYLILFIDVHGGTRMPLTGGYVSLVVLVPMVMTMVDFRAIPNSMD